ncbi:MAG: hypothetical protein RIT27_625 [Pseudomonadota bacterium]|jgi:hypothetical protein
MILRKQHAFILSIFLSLQGCGSHLLPSVKTTTDSPWENFSQAKAAFDQIEIGKTTTTELKQLGIDPFTTPNVKQITYLEVIQHFMPNNSIRVKDLDKYLQECIKVRKECYGYELSPDQREEQRHGNVVLDLLNFRRQTEISGWKFVALIILKEDKVVYKLWGGEPKILKHEDRKNPLGPLQSVGNLLTIDMRK